ncbi:MAG: GNAT family N-acetyltransferase [Oscillospiraceae bacterium]|nr:GNAT family N-acetyltransferase [Oscillospiraceae bacterium]
MYVTESNRLVYRRLETGDFDDLKMMLADPQVMYAWEHTFSDEQIYDWIKKQKECYRLDGVGYFAAVDRSSQNTAGQIGLHRFSLNDETAYEVCYMLKRQYFHRGYAAEGVGAMLAYASSRLELSAVYAQIKTNNIPSVKVAERAGFIKQSVFTKHYNGRDMPHYLYKKEIIR